MNNRNIILLSVFGFIGILSVATLASPTIQEVVRSGTSENSSLPQPLLTDDQTSPETTETDTVNLQKGLEAYYRFDNPKVSRGYSLEFDGSDDYISFPDSGLPKGDSPLTISTWVYQDDLDNRFYVGGWGNCDDNDLFFLSLNEFSSGQFSIETNGNGWTSSATLEADKWYHVAATYEGSGDPVFYVNGQQYGVSSTWGSPNVTIESGSGAIGSITGTGCSGGYTDGDLDNLRIYNSSLAHSEIKSLFNGEKINENLVYLQKFSEGPSECDLTGSISCIEDDSKYDHPGTPQNFNDNKFDTGSGWLNETPINRPSVGEHTDQQPAGLYGGNNGKLENFYFNSSSGWSEPKIGDYSLNFSGGEAVTLRRHPEFEGGFTLSFWAYHDGTDWSDWHNYFNNGEVFIRKDSGGEDHLVSAFIVNNDSNAGGSDDWLRMNGGLSDALEKNKWYHIGFTWNGDTAKLYQNGEEIASRQWSKSLIPEYMNDASPQIGKGERQNDGSHGMNGRIDDFRIYNSALSSSEIKSLYREEQVAEDLEGRWNFESGDRGIAYDTAGLRSQGVLGTRSVAMRSKRNITVSPRKDISGDSEVSVSAWYRNSRYKFGDGSDGSVTVTGQKRIDEDLKSNGRTYPDAVNYVAKRVKGGEVSTFSTPDGIREGDQVLVVNLQGTASKYGNVGEYSVRRVESLNYSLNEIILENEVSGEFGDATYQNIVVQRVPEYTDLTVDGGELTVSDWSRTSIESCPEGWTYHAGECYMQTSSDSWSNTRSVCRDYGGELARIDNSSVNSFIADNFPDSWIGFRDISGPDHGGTDSPYEWVWTYRDYYDFKNFASGEPSIDGVDHNPTTRIGSGGSWYTEYGDNNTYPGVCELDKKKGGILAFEASEELTTINGGLINATGKGYRGGDCTYCGDDADGRAGEGIAGTGKYGFYGETNNLNGGAGAYVDNNDGGDPAGGGGYATKGGTTDRGQDGGISVGRAELGQIYFGGGGGTGSDNDGNTPYPEDSHGGGIIHIESNNIENLRIESQGIDGKTDCGEVYAAQSGGGAGGTVYLSALNANIQEINASGGSGIYDGEDGPNNNQCLSGERSGDGGEGRIRINNVGGSQSGIHPEPYDTGLMPNLVREKGEFGLGGYRDIIYGNINNRSAAFAQLSDGVEWRNLVLSFGSGSAEFYLDGKKVDGFEKNVFTSLDNNLIISGGIEGKVDEVRTYNRSLSSKEVRRLAFR